MCLPTDTDILTYWLLLPKGMSPKSSNKHAILQNLSISYTRKNIKEQNKTINSK